ncbi:MAG: RNB domain-containing ribonuclease, partial [Candidatus Latescibacteria bacterium]|nr:RNB domain-containing ribonuclease [Candidatus Latescibacterota bacterium]
VFLEAMAHLRRVGAVVTDSPDHWRETTGRGHLVGRLHVVDKGFGFVVSEGSSKDVYVASNRMSSAINGDTVVVQIVKRDGRRGGPEGRVLGVAERGMTRLVGAFTSVGDEGWVGPDDPAIKQMVTVAVPEGIPCPSGAKVVVELDPPEAGTGLSGQITQVLGELGDPGVDIESIVHTFSLSRAYSSEAIAHAAGIVSDIEPQEIASRTDLRDVPTFTIDPKTAADMDDALSLEWTDDGLARVGIHIADVTHYIKPGSPVDLEASERSTSVYLPGEVIHMLPESLPSDVCSLRPGVDRLTMSAIADLDGGGGVTSVRFVRSVINSGAKLSYEEAQEVIDGTNAEDSPASGFAESIGQLHALAQTLRQRRRKEGSIEFDLPEPVVIFGDDGQIEAVTHAEHLQSHELIEEFMLLANRLVAEKLTEEEIPTLYRVHEPPSPERISDLNSLIKALGQGVLLPKNITPKAVQELVDTYRGKPAESVVVT